MIKYLTFVFFERNQHVSSFSGYRETIELHMIVTDWFLDCYYNERTIVQL